MSRAPEKAPLPKLSRAEIRALLEVSAVTAAAHAPGGSKRWGKPLALSAPGLLLLTLGWAWLSFWPNVLLAIAWLVWVVYVFRKRLSAPGW